jgi:hypothetical protein
MFDVFTYDMTEVVLASRWPFYRGHISGDKERKLGECIGLYKFSESCFLPVKVIFEGPGVVVV